MGWPFRRKRDMPEGLWTVCPGCEKYVYNQQVDEALGCCPECGEHFPVSGVKRIEITADPGSYREISPEVRGRDVLGFVDGGGPYGERLTRHRKKTKLPDACVTGTATIRGIEVVLGALDFRFMGGSMGHAVGEKVAHGLEAALERDLAFVMFSASGGARMQEGALSLMQMAKTSAAVQRFKERGRCPYISVLTHPTTGGVTASFSALGDLILAEPDALIGFAGPRVIKQTIRQDLPEGFQRSEFLLERGFVDRIVPRGEMRETLASILALLLPSQS